MIDYSLSLYIYRPKKVKTANIDAHASIEGSDDDNE